jgi:hypothetical protein
MKRRGGEGEELLGNPEKPTGDQRGKFHVSVLKKLCDMPRKIGIGGFGTGTNEVDEANVTYGPGKLDIET